MKIELIDSQEIFTIIPLLQVLNPDIDEATLQSRLKEMVEQGYLCVGVYDDENLIGISGLWILTKYYIGKHIEPDNMIFYPEYRNKGLGKMLMQWIYDFGKSQGCVASELNCYISNDSGNKFWQAEGYSTIANHYQKKL